MSEEQNHRGLDYPLSEVVISRPDLQPVRHKILGVSFTGLAWGVWVYLWLPLITFALWYVGIDLAGREFGGAEWQRALGTLAMYLVVIVSLAVILLSWSRYNLIRFRGVDRRKTPRSVSWDQVEEHFGLSREDIIALQGGRFVSVSYNENQEAVSVVAERVDESGGLDSEGE